MHRIRVPVPVHSSIVRMLLDDQHGVRAGPCACSSMRTQGAIRQQDQNLAPAVAKSATAACASMARSGSGHVAALCKENMLQSLECHPCPMVLPGGCFAPIRSWNERAQFRMVLAARDHHHARGGLLGGSESRVGAHGQIQMHGAQIARRELSYQPHMKSRLTAACISTSSIRRSASEYSCTSSLSAARSASHAACY